MKKTDPNSVEKRIREIAAEISSITEFAEGRAKRLLFDPRREAGREP